MHRCNIRTGIKVLIKMGETAEFTGCTGETEGLSRKILHDCNFANEQPELIHNTRVTRITRDMRGEYRLLTIWK